MRHETSTQIGAAFMPQFAAGVRWTHGAGRGITAAKKPKGGATMGEMGQFEARTIILVCVHPPIPIRTLDYCAYFADDKYGKYGWGPTASEAVRSLCEDL